LLTLISALGMEFDGLSLISSEKLCISQENFLADAAGFQMCRKS